MIKLRDLSAEDIYDIVEKVETSIGVSFCTEEIIDVLKLSARKCDISGEGIEYLPIMFEFDLKNQAQIRYINLKGARNRCVNFA